MMKRLVGLVATVALMGSGVALADDTKKQQQGGVGQQMEQPYGGSGPEAMGQMGAQQITGTVVETKGDNVYVKTDQGFVVPLKITRQTQFQPTTIKRARDLQEGQRVQASLNVKDIDNEVTRLSLAPGAGGAGQQPMQHDTGMGQQPGGAEGGSGLEEDSGLQEGGDISQ
jgi:hypothetical protein